MDSDFKPLANSGSDAGLTSGDAKPITVTSSSSANAFGGSSTATSSPSSTNSLDGVSAKSTTPSLVTSSPMASVKPEPSPTIAAAAAEFDSIKPAIPPSNTLSFSSKKDDDLDLSDLDNAKATTAESKPIEKTPSTPSKKPKSRTWVYALSLLLAMGVAGAAGWFAHAYFNKSTPAPVAKAPVVSAPVKVEAPLTAASLIAELSKTATPAAYVEGYAPYSKPDGATFAVQPIATQEKSVNFSVTDANKEAEYVKVKTWLEGKGLTATIDNPTEASKTPSTTFMAKGAELFCSTIVSNAGTTTATPDARLFVRCADKADYTTLITKLTPLYDQYIARNPDANKDGKLVMTDYKDVASKTAGYLLAEPSVGSTSGGGAKALFYQSSDKQWHYVASHQSTTASVPCTTFNTPELKKAYQGQACANGTTQDTIKM
ncbi:MAG: hypothetical protein QG629_495 [Patescibacteria group bacterium]|nr:hypothetical protein [Candidatus Saccharibacteria bacterium]MDQ5963413.1 hypothetical protein [Patescibacteria group bacterium]